MSHQVVSDGHGFAALFFAVAAWLLFEASPAQGQASSTTTTTTLNASEPVCHTSCCNKEPLQREAFLACKEFTKWGISDTQCALWQANAAKFCNDHCSNCTMIAKAMYDQCLFFIQKQMEFLQAIAYCRVIEEDFLVNGRCISACNMTVDDCAQPEGNKCMAKCGNYQTCGVFMWRGFFGQPDAFVGETVMKGYIPNTNPIRKYMCRDIPETCKNHRFGRKCGKYKHCKLNMCLVKNITCPITDTCEKDSACEKSTGKCYYRYWEDGKKCDDKLFYTHDDTCMGGECIGWVDRCLRDDVQCETSNPCLVKKGSCHDRTGTCVFNKTKDGTSCVTDMLDPSLFVARQVNGKCRAGVCKYDATDLCAFKTCPYYNRSDKRLCHKKPYCDPGTGQCIADNKPEGVKCDDENPKSYNDMCIEGKCVGDAFPAPQFKSIGTGLCADKAGVMLRRYFADTFSSSECETQCYTDPQCVGYSYGYHMCSIYGGNRSSHPEVYRWGHYWMLGSIMGDVFSTSDEVYKTIAPTESEHEVECKKKVKVWYVMPESTPIGHEIVFGILIAIIVSTPGSWYLLRKLRKRAQRLADEKEALEAEKDGAEEKETSRENASVIHWWIQCCSRCGKCGKYYCRCCFCCRRKEEAEVRVCCCCRRRAEPKDFWGSETSGVDRLAALGLVAGEPAQSPRNGEMSPSAVAMSPDATGDDSAVADDKAIADGSVANDTSEAAQKQPESSAQPETNAQPETSADLGGDASTSPMRDPRGEVEEEPKVAS